MVSGWQSVPGFRWLADLVRGLLARRWVRFGIVGGAASVSYFLLGLLFVNVAGLPTLAGNALAYALSFIVSYLGQCLWTFRAADSGAGIASHRTMLPRFAATQVVGLCCNSAIVWLLVRLGVPYAWAMPVAVLTVPVMVYALCKVWVFRTQASFAPAGAGQSPVQQTSTPHTARNEDKA